MADLGKMKFLKRFPENKHDQILQLMSYIEMCGVSGRDLVSIGGYIDRRAVSARYQDAKQRVQEYIDQGTVRNIGSDRKDQIMNRFKWKTLSGDYNFETNGWSTWDVVSVKTKIKQRVTTQDRQWPSHVHWTRRHFFNVVLDIAEGQIQLNF